MENTGDSKGTFENQIIKRGCAYINKHTSYKIITVGENQIAVERTTNGFRETILGWFPNGEHFVNLEAAQLWCISDAFPTEC